MSHENNKFQLKYLSATEYNLWDSFVDEIYYATVFNKSFYVAKLSKLLSAEFSILVVINSEQKIVAGFAFCHHKKMSSIKTILYPPMMSYYSILVQDSITKYKLKRQENHHEILNTLLSQLEKDFKILYFDVPPTYLDLRPFIWQNYQTQPKYTYTQNITNIHQLEEDFEYALKKQLNKARKLTFFIDNQNSTENIINLYRLQKKIFDARKIFFPFSEADFIELITTMFENNAAKIFTLFYQEIPICSTMVYLYKQQSFHMLLANDEKYLATGLNSLLLFEMLIYLQNNGITEFDFLGANIQSIAKYKANFNFHLKTYFHIRKATGMANIYLQAKDIIKKM